MGKLGDIGVKTTHLDDVIDILNHSNKIKLPKNYDEHRVYYRTKDGWTPADTYTRNPANHKPCTTHPAPEIGTSFVLEPFSFTWRNVRNYYGDNHKIFDQLLDSMSRDREAAEPSVGTDNDIFC
jgi:hypothetical protein